jgi:hypothetical protein
MGWEKPRMLFRNELIEEIAAGRVTLAFRKWRRPGVRAGGRLRTSAGELAIDALDKIKISSLNNADARRAGFASLDELKQDLAGQRRGSLYRIHLRLAGTDPRERLREVGELSEHDIRTLEYRLGRFDKSSPVGPWTTKVLKLIARHPELPAVKLARKGGYDPRWLKVNVRKLRELGLTQSRLPGYRISPRGQAYLQQL